MSNEEIFPQSTVHSVEKPRTKAWLLETTSTLIIPETVSVLVGGIETFQVEVDILRKSDTIFPNSMLIKALTENKVIYVADEVSNFQLALRLLREGKIDPSFKKSRSAVYRCLLVARAYSLDELTNILTDRYSIMQNVVMPEIAALLETNPHRKLLLYRSVVRKARLTDILSGGSNSINSKAARIKVASSLIEYAGSAKYSISETWKRKFLREAEKLLSEGRNKEFLPPTLQVGMDELRKKMAEIRTHTLLHSDDISTPLVLRRDISETKRVLLERKVHQKYVKIISLPKQRLQDPDICYINCGGRKQYKIHHLELMDLGIFRDYIDNARNFFIGDDPSRFELAMHLLRCDAKLDENEKADESVLKSYRAISRSYDLPWPVSRRIDLWIFAHKNGVGGARNTREEIRALELTRIINSERGDALVASALSEGFLERAETESGAKKYKLLQKAETNLRTVLPVLLTSLSVVRVNEEQKVAINQAITNLKKVLILQGREAEAKDLDSAVAIFSQGIEGAAKELASLTREAPTGMYS